MKRFPFRNLQKQVAALCVAAALSAVGACSSVESAKLDGSSIASNGEAVAVIQATHLGLYLLFNVVPVVESNLDIVVNKLLVTEAKALGGNKVELLQATESPKDNIFRVLTLIPGIVNVASAQAQGIAVK